MKKSCVKGLIIAHLSVLLPFCTLDIAKAQKAKPAINMTISFEKNPTTTATYEEVVEFYTALDQQFDQCKLLTYGDTDFGKPLHVLVLSKEKLFDPSTARAKNKLVVLINNGIHPGEPEGIDASMMLARDLLSKNALPENMVICI